MLVIFLTLNKSIGYFVDFEQVKKILVVILLTLNKSKIKVTTKLPWEKLDAYAFFWLSPHVIGTPPWLLRRVRVSTSSELYANSRLFFECLGIQFFNLLTCGLQDTMPCQRSPTLIPREAEDFSRGDTHSKHVPPPTYLA